MMKRLTFVMVAVMCAVLVCAGSVMAAITYVDANLGTTQSVSGGAWSTSVDSDTDNLWTLVGPDYAIGSTVLASSGSTTEDSPMLKTSVSGLANGVYDVYAVQWVHSVYYYYWNMKAGLDQNALSIYNIFQGTVIGDLGWVQQRQVYLGQTTGTSITVFADDVTTAEAGYVNGRTWYDGIGYELVQAVPEPSALVALGTGLMGIAGLAIRRRR